MNLNIKSFSEYRRYLLYSISLTILNNDLYADTVLDTKYNYQILSNKLNIQNYKLPKIQFDNHQESKFVFEYKELRNNVNLIQIINENENFIIGFLKIVGLSEIDDSEEIANIYKINQDAAHIVLVLKNKFNRIRPSYINSDIKPVISVPQNSSYPGGHAAQAYLIALYLSKKNPKYTEQLFQYAFQIGINREIAGLHYPSDTSAGYILAKNIYLDLEKNFKGI